MKDKIKDNLGLLELMIKDQNKQNSYYKPGIYWKKKSIISYKLIKKYGLNNFRSYENLIGESYSDSINIDYRNTLEKKSFLKSFLFFLTKISVIGKFIDKQVEISLNFHQQYLRLFENMILRNERYAFLKKKYKISGSTVFGNPSEKFFDKELNEEVSILYLNLLDQHDYLAHKIDFNKLNSVFEIGGGFGINIHLLIQNYPNIRKIIYLDIPPNLYTGTQYLKSLYGESVLEYDKLKNNSEIKFKEDNNLEILCIAPWQIEDLDQTTDIFLNSNSFVEMPKNIVQNYSNKILKNNNLKTIIALVSYDNFDLNTTFHPDTLMSFFKNRKNWDTFTKKSLTKINRKNYFYISDYC